ncbi:MAG: 1,4-dihydroxy-2-naphthoate polyprenyltransferase [Chitinophagaceae bacterium]|nr:1,4-dihydroxy-2-naphthoate polyprenyltransferase [Chitinophagaceae bacterium]
MASVSAWLVTFRLRTLPLALSTIILGSFLAAYRNSFHWSIFILAALTTLFLQTLSNLANDYGDTLHGVDNPDRTGPKRSLQTGAITLKQMKAAIVVCILLSLCSGITLLVVASEGLKLSYGLIMLVIGLAAIAAAMKYTMGKRPYGYAGLGDIAVFIFFGLVGVLGTFFLHTHYVGVEEFFPAMAVGFFSTGVLNLNNMRDIENDRLFGKHTIVVKMGSERARWYHFSLILAGIVCAIVYTLTATSSGWKWLFLVTVPLFLRSSIVAFKTKEVTSLDPELKYLALTTLLFSILFGVGLVIA